MLWFQDQNDEFYKEELLEELYLIGGFNNNDFSEAYHAEESHCIISKETHKTNNSNSI